MKILHVMASVAATRGGPSTAVAELSQAQVLAGDSVTVISHDDRGSLPPSHFHPSIHFLSFPLSDPSRWQYSRGQHMWMKKNILKFDAVHIHGIYLAASFLAARLSKAHNIPYVIRPAGSLNVKDIARSSHRVKVMYLRLIEGPYLQAASAIHCTSAAELNDLKRHGLRNGVLVPHGVNDAFLHLGRGTRERSSNILYLGRVTPKKGLRLLVEALPHLSPDTRLNIAGDASSDYAETCRDAARQLGIAERLTWHGHISLQDRLRLMAESSMLVLPSEDENFGIAVVEALASALPVVISPGVSFSTMVSETGSGYVVERRPRDVAKGISAIMCLSDAEYHQMSSRAAQLGAKFSWKKAADELQGVYK